VILRCLLNPTVACQKTQIKFVEFFAAITVPCAGLAPPPFPICK